MKQTITAFLICCFACFAGTKADDTLTINSIPPGAQVELNRKVIGTTPLSWKVGEYAFNVRKSTIFSKHLGTPVIIRVSKDGYIAKEMNITQEYQWHSMNYQNHYNYFIIVSNSFQINLDKIAARPAAMTNADVIKLHEAGFGDDLIIDRINASPAAFNLEFDDLVALRKAQISDAVVQAMMHAK